MKNPKEQKLIEAMEKADRKLVEADRKWILSDHKWDEDFRERNKAKRKLREYQTITTPNRAEGER